MYYTCLYTTQEFNPETAPDNKKLTEINISLVYHTLFTNQGLAPPTFEWLIFFTGKDQVLAQNFKC